jgi:hypothetical protein
MHGSAKLDMSSHDQPDRFRSTQPGDREGDSRASSAVNAARLRDQLISEGGRRVGRPEVFDKDLLYIVARMYRTDAVYGTGSTPDALRIEIQTGEKPATMREDQRNIGGRRSMT